ncbi:hypothetical protein [Lentibacillus sediminis]|uniref:hypothetical protein n=1 Tax=Lentibacillus sediminis TaxID=1940529 RepID=UPI000C1BB7C9|nr:hypothetical protein [Lentibacillus sediminis]
MPYKLISKGTNSLEELHSSSTDIAKVFNTLEDANLMKNELNSITIDKVYWEVAKTDKTPNA